MQQLCILDFNYSAIRNFRFVMLANGKTDGRADELKHK